MTAVQDEPTEQPGESPRSIRPSPWRSRFAMRTWLAGALWLAGIIAGAVTGARTEPGWLAIRVDPAGLLYLAAAVVGGVNFFGAGVRAAARLRLDMNTLMSLAIVAAILIGEPFEAATLAFLFSMAELLERYAADRSRRSIAELLRLAPERADRLRPDGSTEPVAAADLKVGDRIRVRPGDRIAADGRILAGTSAINEAAITGESVPRTKGPGAQVFSGTMNVDGALDIDVTADARHSAVARIVELVRAAEGRRAPIEYFVQRFARIYTPAVTVLAILVILIPPALSQGTQLEWFVRGITLLVIACPCALVIATPVTVVSALTSAARHGVLIKGGEHLERLGAVRALATDKTGTLTTGRLEVTEFRARPATAETGLLGLLAAVEARSEHPIGRAIVRYAAARGVRPAGEVGEFKALPGHGLVASAGATRIAVGTADVVGTTEAAAWDPLPKGTSWVYVSASTDPPMSGVVGLRDGIRPDAARAIARLRTLGIQPIVLLTGDDADVAKQVGQEAGVDETHARLLPDEKVSRVRDLRTRYGAVAMLGDGVNDAPALAEATVGIAMGAAGSPAAIETADVALMADDLTHVPYAVQLARTARRTIRFNIALSIGLKLVLAVGAVSGLVSLAVAVLVGDLGASLVVTGNALRLASIRPE